MDLVHLTKLLGLPEFVVTAYTFQEDSSILLDVKHRHKVAVCPECERVSSEVFEYEERIVRDCSVFDRHCYQRFQGRRFSCGCCGKPFTERLQSIGFNSGYTKRYEERVFQLCRENTVAHVSQTEALGYEAVEGIYTRQAGEAAAARRVLFPRVISIDEISLKKGHKHFVTVISAPEEGCVIDVLADRKKKTLEAWFDALPEAARQGIQVVCIDMCEIFRDVAREKAPQAEIVIDRFHVMKNLQEGIDATRRAIQREAEEPQRQDLKGCRWVILKSKDSLKPEEEERLAHLYEVSPELKVCHELKEEFRSLFNAEQDAETASQKLSAWEERVKESGPEKLQKFLTTLANWREWILNYFHERITNGFAEGLNNRIKLIKRRAFGYTNLEHFRLRILTECV